jgi:hypothetical protein
MRAITLVVFLAVQAFAVQNQPQTQASPQGQASPAQPTPPQTSPAPATAAKEPVPALNGFGLEDGTPVKLRLTRNLSSASDKKGGTVDFEVLEDVTVDGVLVIPRGGIAWATITDAQPKRRMGRGGKLDVNIDSVRLKDGEKVPLRAVKENKGGGHVGAMTGAMVATGIVFFPRSAAVPLHAREGYQHPERDRDYWLRDGKHPAGQSQVSRERSTATTALNGDCGEQRRPSDYGFHLVRPTVR